MYEALVCVAIGYLVGCINPAWMISKTKKADLNLKGSKNLGATNAFFVLGKYTGVFVMLFDIGKAYAAIKLTGGLFPQLAFAGAMTGAATIMGHIFPFYIGFRGGKGLACLGGTILGLDWRLLIPLLLIGILLALITNYACAVPFSAATIFPIAYGIRNQSRICFLIMSVPAIFIIIKHLDNIRRIQNGTETSVRSFFNR